jgi:hypothetical protein
MNCEVLQNRLLALPDPRRVPAELRPHLDGCPACRAFAAGVLRLDALLAELPVPPADDDVRAAFLDRVTAAGPVITRVPVVPSRGSSAQLSAVLARAGLTWRHAAGLAAALMVAVGGYWIATAERSRPQPAAYHRHELLAKEAKWVADLAQAEDPKDRLKLWTGIADDVRGEARALHMVAAEDEMRDLTELYRKAVETGVVAQARRVPDHDRPAAVREAMARLTASAAESTKLADGASPHSRRQLLQMAAIARDGNKALQSLAGGT